MQGNEAEEEEVLIRPMTSFHPKSRGVTFTSQKSKYGSFITGITPRRSTFRASIFKRVATFRGYSLSIDSLGIFFKSKFHIGIIPQK
jgi:hypothetical protein